MTPSKTSMNKIRLNIFILKGDFPGGPVAKIPYSQCRGPVFNPWSGN